MRRQLLPDLILSGTLTLPAFPRRGTGTSKARAMPVRFDGAAPARSQADLDRYSGFSLLQNRR